jgi:hypothetical protein
MVGLRQDSVSESLLTPKFTFSPFHHFHHLMT